MRTRRSAAQLSIDGPGQGPYIWSCVWPSRLDIAMCGKPPGPAHLYTSNLITSTVSEEAKGNLNSAGDS